MNSIKQGDIVVGAILTNNTTIGKQYKVIKDNDELSIIDDNGSYRPVKVLLRWGYVLPITRSEGKDEIVDREIKLETYIDSISDDEQQLALNIYDALEMNGITMQGLITFIDNFNKWDNEMVHIQEVYPSEQDFSQIYYRQVDVGHVQVDGVLPLWAVHEIHRYYKNNDTFLSDTSPRELVEGFFVAPRSIAGQLSGVEIITTYNDSILIKE